MIYKTLISIDIGYSGGIAIFDIAEREHPSHGLVFLKAMPTLKSIGKNGKIKTTLNIPFLKNMITFPSETVVVFEDVHSFPGQGVVSVGALLEQKGLIRGMACALGIDEYSISPKTWQKHFDLIPPKTLKGNTAAKTKTMRKQWIKEHSLETARSLFPDYAEMLMPKTAHGLSDALLIGKWWLDNIEIVKVTQ